MNREPFGNHSAAGLRQLPERRESSRERGVDRLKCVLVAGTLAVAACGVAAGPAVAANGGNNDNAHACQQGGHESLFEAGTGNPFKNAGDCASHGGRGGTLRLLEIDPSRRTCDPVTTDICWGTIEGSGLGANTPWAVHVVGMTELWMTGNADANGNVDVNLMLPCNVEIPAVWATANPSPSEMIETEPPTTSTCN